MIECLCKKCVDKAYVMGHTHVPKPETILQEAQRIVMGDREGAYDHPSRNFERTAELLTAVLKGKLAPSATISLQDVALIMIMLKVARQIHKHGRDNLVDIAGYTECLARIMGEDG